MNRIQLHEWRNKYFTGIKPSLQRLKRKIDNQTLPGTRVGQTEIYIVYCDDNYEPVAMNKKPKPINTENIKNEMAKKILEKYTG